MGKLVFDNFCQVIGDIYVPTTEGGGGHIVFGADPVGVCVGIRIASFLHVIF